MKKNGKAGIPDFSRKPKGFNPKGNPDVNPAVHPNLAKQAPPVAPKVVNVKPIATSSKSGQRGT